ncbi:MAG: hypothetical protein KDK39_10440 [Leptospiraceae bacterium]|nr:hypothetical protein [Leptospiraceae bacterium]
MDQTPVTERTDKFIDLPCRLILTNSGQLLFQKSGTPLKRVTNKEGVTSEGLESPRFNAATVQKLVLNSFLEEIYATLPALLTRRYHIISTNNLIMYGILYKKLSPSLATTMFATNVVKDFNRKNPKHSIVDLKHIHPGSVEALLGKNQALFQRIENEITEAVIENIEMNAALNDEDRQAMLMSVAKFISWIDRRIWYIFFIIYQTNQKEVMKRTFVTMVARYLEHTRLATHLSNLIMEFIQNAEKAHFERIIVKNGLCPRDDVDRWLREKANRDLVMQMAEREGQMLDLAWNMNPERMSVGKQYRIQVSISNYGLIDDTMRDKLNRKLKTNTDGLNISDFYQSSEDPDKLGAGLGLLYNSYLEEICKKEGIHYKCSIFPEPRKEKTSVIIEISL